MGLVTEFKEPSTKKLTKWGAVSLVGIVVSTVVAVLTQIKETERQDKDRNDQQAKYQADLDRNIHISENTNAAVAELRLVLTPLDNLKVSVYLKVQCNTLELRRLCQHSVPMESPLDKFLDNGTAVGSGSHPSLFNDWPSRGRQARVPMSVGIFCHDKAGQEPTRDMFDADLYFQLIGTFDGGTFSEITVEDRQDVTVKFRELPLLGVTSTDRILSTQDFAGCELNFYAETQFPMEPTKLEFDANHGRTIVLDPQRFKLSERDVLQYTFDDKGR